jgi:hypothetical protein
MVCLLVRYMRLGSIHMNAEPADEAVMCAVKIGVRRAGTGTRPYESNVTILVLKFTLTAPVLKAS